MCVHIQSCACPYFAMLCMKMFIYFRMFCLFVCLYTTDLDMGVFARCMFFFKL